jgi:hypothetical protein
MKPLHVLVAGALLLLVLAPRPLPSQSANDAFLDSAAAAMVAGARSRSEFVNSQIQAYETTSRNRVSLGLQATQRDRLLFRREVAARVTWTKEDGRQAEILAGREVVPVADRGVRPVRDRRLANTAAARGFDPMGGWLLEIPTGEDEDDDDGSDLIHPLGPGAEEHYRYRSGETTTIRLPGGRTVRLVELQVLPRRAQPTLLSGSFWLDADTNAPVRGVFSLAAPYRVRPSAGFIPLPLPEGAFTIRYLSMEYGLWEGQWWLPRLITFEGSATVSGISVPLTIEEAFEDYRIYTESYPFGGFAAPDSTIYRVVRRTCREDAEGCTPRVVLVPRDTAVLLASPLLPRSIYSRSGRLISQQELEELTGFVDAVRWRGMLDRIPRFYWSPLDGSLMRYNRVEGLTLGTSAGVELAPLSLDADLWIGLAERSPSFQVELARARVRGTESITLYRHLDAFSPRDRPFSLGSSISAFAFGRDEGDYYRSLGARVGLEQVPALGMSVRLGAYVERQSAVEKRTDVSIPNWSRDRIFRPNPQADAAEQLGMDLHLQTSRGFDPLAFRGGLEARFMAETGSYRFARPSVGAFTTLPLPGRLVGAVEAAAGTSFGDLPVQRNWYVGGRGSVRGFALEERVTGESFWTARGEIGTERPAARLVLFGDAGWAGPRDEFTTDPMLVSAGVGLSFLDGLVRGDLAKALRGGSGWSFQLSVDAPL